MRSDDLIIRNVRTTLKQVNPIVAFNNLPHANLALFQFVFVETLHNVTCAHKVQIHNAAFHFSARQFQTEASQNVQKYIRPLEVVSLGFIDPNLPFSPSCIRVGAERSQLFIRQTNFGVSVGFVIAIQSKAVMVTIVRHVHCRFGAERGGTFFCRNEEREGMKGV